MNLPVDREEILLCDVLSGFTKGCVSLLAEVLLEWAKNDDVKPLINVGAVWKITQHLDLDLSRVGDKLVGKVGIMAIEVERSSPASGFIVCLSIEVLQVLETKVSIGPSFLGNC